MGTLLRTLFRRPAPDPVARGAALLDAEYRLWYLRVNPETLDMSSLSKCVIGQLHSPYGGHSAYDVGLDRLGLSRRAARRYGFDVFHLVDFRIRAEVADAHQQLTDRWAALIRDRRAADDVRAERLVSARQAAGLALSPDGEAYAINMEDSVGAFSRGATPHDD
jgi:hypothetical protein